MGSFLQKLLTNPEDFKFYTGNQKGVINPNNQNPRTIPFGNDKSGGGSSNQPYIKKGLLNTSLDSAFYNDFTIRGGILAPLNAAEDVIRLTKYFADIKNPKGLLFLAKENILSRIGTKTEASKGAGYLGGGLNEGAYTPLSTIGQALVGFAGGHLNKQGLDPTGLFPGANINKYQNIISENQLILPDDYINNRLINLIPKPLNTNPNQSTGILISLLKGYSVNPPYDPATLIEYGGGPGSVLGIGKTKIRFATTNDSFSKLTVFDNKNNINSFVKNAFSPLTIDGTSSLAKNLNRLVNLSKKEPITGDISYFPKFTFGKNQYESDILLEYKGGPGSKDKIDGSTTIKYATDNSGFKLTVLDNKNNINSFQKNAYAPLRNVDTKVADGVNNNRLYFLLKKEPKNFPYFKYFPTYDDSVLITYPKSEFNGDPDNRVTIKYATDNHGFKLTVFRKDLSTYLTKEDSTITQTNEDRWQLPLQATLKYNSLQTSIIQTTSSKDYLTYITTGVDSYNYNFVSSVYLNGEDNKPTLNPRKDLSTYLTKKDTTNTTVLIKNKGEEQLKKYSPSSSLINNISNLLKEDNPITLVNPQYNTSFIFNIPDSQEHVIVDRALHPKFVKQRDQLTRFPSAVDENYKLNPNIAYDSSTYNKKNPVDSESLIDFNIIIVNPQSPSKNQTQLNFIAYIDDLSDSYGAEWSKQSYMGRGELFYKYNSFSRNMNLGFTIVADNQTMLTDMYAKLNTLAGSLAPTYSSAGYMMGNLHRLTIGNYIYKQYGIIESLDYNIGMDNGWGTKNKSSNSQLPYYITVTFKFTPIHNFRPESNFNLAHSYIYQNSSTSTTDQATSLEDINSGNNGAILSTIETTFSEDQVEQNIEYETPINLLTKEQNLYLEEALNKNNNTIDIKPLKQSFRTMDNFDNDFKGIVKNSPKFDIKKFEVLKKGLKKKYINPLTNKPFAPY